MPSIDRRLTAGATPDAQGEPAEGRATASRAVQEAELVALVEQAVARMKVGRGGSSPALRRLELALRTVALDRRRTPRFPWAVPLAIETAHGRHATLTLDVGEGGLMIDRPEGFIAAEGDGAWLDIVDIGPLRAEIVAVDEDSISLRVAREGDGETKLRFRAIVNRLSAANAAGHERAARLAREGGEVFEAALARGDIDLETLFSTRLTALPDTQPRHFAHPALDLYQRALPPILARHHALEAGVIYAVLTDAQGYVPVHNQRFSQPQRPDDPEFNRKFARDRRVFDDRWTLRAARFSRGPLVQTVRRDVPHRHGRLVREFSCPIFVAQRRWGAALIGFSLE